MTFAIDNIPSLTDDLPYTSYEVKRPVPLICLAGFGPLSNGIPEPIGNHGESEREMPPPPRASRPVCDYDKTQQMRKPCQKTS